MSDSVKAKMAEDGNTDNYFGGDGKDDGDGHGHVTVTPQGEVTHAREAEQHMPGTERSERVSVDEPRQDHSSEVSDSDSSDSDSSDSDSSDSDSSDSD